MTVELWQGEEFEHTHEMAALGVFLGAMRDSFDAEPETYLVLSNFILDNQNIDLAVVKRNGLVVIELKEAHAPVEGGENGPWMIGRPGEKKVQLKGGGHANPFVQVRGYHQTLIGFLQANQGRFLRPRAGQSPALHHVSALIALAPKIPEGSTFHLPERRWLRVVGLDQLHLEVYRQRSPELNLSTREMRTLVRDVMRLRKVEMDRHLLSTSTAPIEEAEVVKPRLSQDDTAPRAPVAIQMGLRIGAPEGLPEAIETPQACPICRLTKQQCDVPVLRGKILDVSVQGGGEASFQVEIGEVEPSLLNLRGPWGDLAKKLKGAQQHLLARGREEPFEIAAYHLSREGGALVAGSSSFVVLDPDWLVNVTSLTEVEYCQRQLPLNRYSPSPTNAAMIRGNVVHQLFPEIWRRGDIRALEEARGRVLQANSEAMALASTTAAVIRAAADVHVMHLRQWAHHQKRSDESELRTETFILSPIFGIKGRIDALWERDTRPVVLGELKTGRSQGEKPRPGHALQLRSYGLGLLSRPDVAPADVHAILLYSGNDPLGTDGRNVLRRVSLDVAALQESIRIRNDLVLIDHTGEAAFETNPNKCAKCSVERQCARLAILAGQEDPRETKSPERLGQDAAIVTPKRAEFFQHYATLLTDELRAVKAEYAKLWSMPAPERVSEGKAMFVQGMQEKEGSERSRLYSLLSRNDRNESEFRSGDGVLVSGDEPGKGPTLLASVEEVSSRGIVIRTQEEVRFHPALVDLYTDERLTEAQFGGLFRALSGKNPVVDAVVSGRPPTFLEEGLTIPRRRLSLGDVKGLNGDQQRALELSLKAEEYLLVVGPPGSGKTMLIEHMVHAHLAHGRRVLICAGTNRALDEALRRLVDQGLSDQLLRLGSAGSAGPGLAPYTLTELMSSHQGDLEEQIGVGDRALKSRSVVGSTVHTLLSGRYEEALRRFDLVIVDEAAQLTVPATLGAVRLGDRSVLIGDHRQLPAVVIGKKGGRGGSPPEAEGGKGDLDVSLFEILFNTFAGGGGQEIVRLTDQYRMNGTICQVPSRSWYEGELRPADDVVRDGRLQVPLEAALEDPVLSPQRPIVVVDVEPNAAGGPRTSLSEAKVVRRLVRGLRDAGFPAFDERRPLAVIAPFRAQVALIRRELEAEFPQNPEEIRRMVDTVDRFQGSESDMVILSLATGDGNVHELVRNERRLNVAITRARHKLVILGSVPALRRDPTYYSLLEEIGQAVDYEDWCLSGRNYLEGTGK